MIRNAKILGVHGDGHGIKPTMKRTFSIINISVFVLLAQDLTL